jgi:hypothetical protein
VSFGRIVTACSLVGVTAYFGRRATACSLVGVAAYILVEV